MRRTLRYVGVLVGFGLVGLLVYVVANVIRIGTGSTVKVKAHVHNQGDPYCVYPITGFSAGAPLKVGDKICLYCADPSHVAKCDAIAKFEMAGGVSYDVGGADNPACDECPGRHYYELDK